MNKWFAALACLGALLLLNTRARAEGRWTPSVELTTTVPLDISERVSLEAPNRLHLRAGIGFMPYASLIDRVIQGFGGYGAAEAEVIKQALSKSLVFRVQAGFRPLPELGLYMDVGYSLITLGGDLDGNDVIVLGRGFIAPQDATSPFRHYRVSSTLHLVVLEIGWEQPILPWLFARGALGFAGAQGASSSIEPTFSDVDSALLNAYCDQAAEYLDQLYTTYVYTPTLTLGLGVRF
ncbi:MAG TPA: hypothetical protein VK524_09025 [Polyangiaceae bacterium]|nr:hypothetical protein [Polyangiaceae bacterium]